MGLELPEGTQLTLGSRVCCRINHKGKKRRKRPCITNVTPANVALQHIFQNKQVPRLAVPNPILTTSTRTKLPLFFKFSKNTNSQIVRIVSKIDKMQQEQADDAGCLPMSDSSKPSSGRLAIGRRAYTRYPAFLDSSLDGYTTILCLSKSSTYGSISPFCLTDKAGQILENVWQFGKVYSRIPAQKIPKTHFDPQIVWDWPAQTHWDDKAKQPTPEYWQWRNAGMACPHPIRYPVGRRVRTQCLGYLTAPDAPLLGYIDARKQVYLPLMLDALRGSETFLKLQARLANGENLLIVEVDGPHYESLGYYKQKYGVGDDFISPQNTMAATMSNLAIMLDDPKHPFGHGYCVAAALLGCGDALMSLSSSPSSASSLVRIEKNREKKGVLGKRSSSEAEEEDENDDDETNERECKKGKP